MITTNNILTFPKRPPSVAAFARSVGLAADDAPWWPKELDDPRLRATVVVPPKSWDGRQGPSAVHPEVSIAGVVAVVLDAIGDTLITEMALSIDRACGAIEDAYGSLVCILTTAPMLDTLAEAAIREGWLTSNPFAEPEPPEVAAA